MGTRGNLLNHANQPLLGSAFCLSSIDLAQGEWKILPINHDNFKAERINDTAICCRLRNEPLVFCFSLLLLMPSHKKVTGLPDTAVIELLSN